MWNVVKKALTDSLEDDALTQASAIAFYAGLSFAPLLLLLLWSFDLVSDEMQRSVVSRITEVLGAQAAGTVDTIVRNAKERPDLGSIAGIVSAITLFFSASGVFGQLQSALNRVWNVKPAPQQQLVEWAFRRLTSAILILMVAAVLIVSLILSAAVQFVLTFMRPILPQGISELAVQLANIGIPFVMYLLLFAAIYRFLPDVALRWRDVWGGALVTAVLFTIGRVLIAWYLGASSATSAYGAMGSLLAFLIWVYYSSIVLLFGAELTQAWLVTKGRPVRPRSYAVPA